MAKPLRWTHRALLLSLVILFGATSRSAGDVPASPDEQATVRIEYESATDRVSITAFAAPLDRVLQEIAKETGLTLEVATEAVRHERVTVTIRDRALDLALQALLEAFDTVFVYSPSAVGSGRTEGVRLTEVSIVSRREPAVPGSPALSSGRGEERVGESARGGPVTEDELVRSFLDLQQSGRHAELTDYLLERVKHSDAAVRRIVVSFLIRSPDLRAGQALADVLHGETDLQSRQLAAYGLVQRGDVARGVAILSRALKDPNPEVRYAALVALGSQGQTARPAVAEALEDPDPRVAQTARILMDDMGPRR